MFEDSGKPSEVIIIKNEKHCIFCNDLIQGNPDTWRAMYKGEQHLVGYAHKNCLEGKKF